MIVGTLHGNAKRDEYLPLSLTFIYDTKVLCKPCISGLSSLEEEISLLFEGLLSEKDFICEPTQTPFLFPSSSKGEDFKVLPFVSWHSEESFRLPTTSFHDGKAICVGYSFSKFVGTSLYLCYLTGAKQCTGFNGE